MGAERDDNDDGYEKIPIDLGYSLDGIDYVAVSSKTLKEYS